MRHQGSCINRERACRLNSIRQLQAQGNAQSRGAFRDVDVERNRLPAFNHRAVPPCERFVTSLQWADQYLGVRDGGDREPQAPAFVSFEQGPEPRSESHVVFQKMNDRRRIQQDQCLLRQIFESYRVHSSRSLRTVSVLFFPHSPRPEPCSGSSDGWRTTAPYASMGTNTATGLPCRVIIVEYLSRRRPRGPAIRCGLLRHLCATSVISPLTQPYGPVLIISRLTRVASGAIRNPRTGTMRYMSSRERVTG
jgi:hypothetical protein